VSAIRRQPLRLVMAEGTPNKQTLPRASNRDECQAVARNEMDCTEPHPARQGGPSTMPGLSRFAALHGSYRDAFPLELGCDA
jgi:hypothetical protein